MKPRFETMDHAERRDSNVHIAHRLPVTDHNYQSVALDGYNHCAKTRRPSFLNISRDYFANEARHSFVGEASFFVSMIATSAVSVILGAYALADFIRAVGM